jgi:penicillin-binding protein 1B
MISLLEEVMRSGTAAGVRARGFTLPSAGKTGSSHDGWFAGFTSKLICVVWVGFDDNTDIRLEGAKSALPIWTEFMKRAHQRRQYRTVTGWDAPDGIVSVDIDPTSGQLATAACPSSRAEVFVSGSQPVELCRLHGGGVTHVAGWETSPAVPPTAAAASNGSGQYRTAQSVPPTSIDTVSPQPIPAEKSKDKKGVLGRIKDIFR